MEQTKKIDSNLKKSPNGDDMEEITVRVIKTLLEEDVPMEDIQHITKKSVEEIKKIGGLSD